ARVRRGSACANAGLANRLAPANAANSRRVETVLTFALRSMCRRFRGSLLLRSPKPHRENKPSDHHRQRTERNSAEFQTQGLHSVEDPPGQRIRAAIDDDID